MKESLLKFLRCPKTKESLSLTNEVIENGYIKSGTLLNQDSSKIYNIKNFIPRFVNVKNYSDSFGMQWNLFSDTQMDSKSGINISADRFWHATEWSREELKGKLILDIGCGTGRFAEVCLDAGATVICLDYASSVDTCRSNLIHFKNFHIIQADVFELPFLEYSFDYVYSLGVLQHTPDPKKAFLSLAKMISSKGKLCVDFYEKSMKSFFLPKYWLRPITKNMNDEKLLLILKLVVPILFPVSRFLGLMPFGYIFKRVIPVADPIFFYERSYRKTNMKYSQILEWSLLDTFDWLSPAYDNPQSKKSIRNMAQESKIKNLEILKAGHLVLRTKN